MQILVINGHPHKESLCAQLAENYLKGALQTGKNARLIHLADLNFSLNLKYGYQQRTPLEPDLQKAWDDIQAANHLVMVYPTWWGTYPALLKGFIDRLFLPGMAFRYRENSLLWDKLLKGKTARLLVTMDTPKWYYKLVYLQPGHNSMRKNILEFCGIKPVKITSFGPVKTASQKRITSWLLQVQKLGERGV